ncbi:MAG TPA: prolyl oligopeptidase family serine peptidase, partial [Ignavibacteriaceae bacterium]|nr:prolyl oligopeptidase family serine peptidase [Ignavibacteriaceae bacterium]
DVYDFYSGVSDMLTFPENSKEFFWISDRDGHQHIYRYDYNGKLIQQVTKGNWSVTKVDGIDMDNKVIYFESTEVSPLERQLYLINFDGSGEKKITMAEGAHRINMSPNCKYFIDTYSNVSLPTQVEVSSTSDGMLKKLVDNNSVTEYLKTHAYSPTELQSFTTSDGVKIDFSIIKPYDFDASKKYPVIFAIYGGPGSQGVYNRFGTSAFDQFLSQKGYIIIDVNNRGTANYSSHFMKQVYKHLGKWESNDFVETAKYLSTLPYVDKVNMAIMGTSYGGYSTTYTMLNHPGVFKVGIANSPVTDWRLYDNIYTERYMGLLNENEDGYIQSASTTNAKNLEGHLLLIHSDLDDNVHIANTMQLLTALTNAGKDFDLRIFPPGAHGAAYNMQSYFLLTQIYYNYLDRWLKGGQNQISINK